jgi:serine/threonine protein kinase
LIDKIKGPLLPSEKTVAGWLKSIIKALTYLHDLKIVHRDIKPENIILSFVFF